jgi:hypothetical protein
MERKAFQREQQRMKDFEIRREEERFNEVKEKDAQIEAMKVTMKENSEMANAATLK